MNHTAAVILAAGASRRFGQSKQLLDWLGTPLVAHTADVALRAGLAPVVVVLGCQAQRVGEALHNEGLRPLQTAMNWRWKEGLGTSVQVGLSALPPDTEAAIFMQCDQPLVTADLLRALVARFQDTDAPIVHPTHAGQRRSPALISRCFFSELAAVTGDEGGRAIIARHADAAAAIEVADPDVLADIDTPADYERLLNKVSSLSQRLHRELESSEGKPRTVLSGIRHLIIDMDGVLWHGGTPLAGLREFFEFLHGHHIGFILATNNSSRLPEQYAEKLGRFGVVVSPAHVLTSSQATAAYLASIAAPGTRVYAIGDEGVRHALAQRGFVLTDEGAEHVVVGWDRQLTWDKLATAALLIHAGAKFVGTNPDTTYPTERGPVPGNGAQLASLEITTGITPVVVGKPEPWMYLEALRRMGASSESTAVVGDRLETDIGGAARIGLTTVLVLSGIATEADLALSPVKPDLVCAGIKELVQLWKEQLPQQSSCRP